MGISGIALHALNGARAIWRLTGHESSGALEETRQIAKAAHAQENQAELQQLSQQITATPPPAAETTGTELTNGDGEGLLEGVLDVLGDAWDRISDLF